MPIDGSDGGRQTPGIRKVDCDRASGSARRTREYVGPEVGPGAGRGGPIQSHVAEQRIVIKHARASPENGSAIVERGPGKSKLGTEIVIWLPHPPSQRK